MSPNQIRSLAHWFENDQQDPLPFGPDKLVDDLLMLAAKMGAYNRHFPEESEE